jgi:hypothetical protein
MTIRTFTDLLCEWYYSTGLAALSSQTEVALCSKYNGVLAILFRGDRDLFQNILT